jgi:hypothetical protein
MSIQVQTKFSNGVIKWSLVVAQTDTSDDKRLSFRTEIPLGKDADIHLKQRLWQQKEISYSYCIRDVIPNAVGRLNKSSLLWATH